MEEDPTATDHQPSPGPLRSIRVVDFTRQATGQRTTTVLADYGADVILVESPGIDGRREHSGAFLLRGKRSVIIDLDTASGREAVSKLVDTADVVVVDGTPGDVRQRGLNAELLRADRPRLVHCTLSPWGMTGPYCDLPGNEHVVAAKAGRMAFFEPQLRRGRPVYAALPVAIHATSQGALQGILAALIQRRTTATGANVETSLLQSLMIYDLVDLIQFQLASQNGTPFASIRDRNPMPTLNYHPVQAADGVWIQNGNLLEHLFYSFLDAIDLLGELLVDERFQSSPAQWAPESIEEVRDRMLLRMQERPSAEWMSIFHASGNVAAEPIVETPAAITHPDLVDGRGLVDIDDLVLGPTTQIAPMAELESTPAQNPVRAPAAGEHTDEILQELAQLTDTGDRAKPPDAPTDPNRSRRPGSPLDGIIIVDLSTIIAGPLSTVMLADLGARVIKVEPLGGDPFRKMMANDALAIKTNLGKESICIDLKTARGQQILHDLVADADVLVHNFRGSVPAKLGIDFETLRGVNPRLIWAVVNGYGPHGPSAPRPATHPVMGAGTGGVAWQAGEALTRSCETLEDVREAARQIMVANDANPDPNTSVVAASAILLALLARGGVHDGSGAGAGDQRTGEGQIVRINMQLANAWANADDFLSYSNKPDRTPVDADHLGLHALHRLYETAEGWLFLSATGDDDFARLAARLGRPELAELPKYATVDARRTNDDPLIAELSEIFRSRTAAAWESELTAASVGCVRADGIDIADFLTSDPQVLANTWTPFADHSELGRLRRWGPLVTVGGPMSEYRFSPSAGEHTDVLLADLGHDEASITSLRDQNVVR